jgi:PTS system cellobiose-specific IIC component
MVQKVFTERNLVIKLRPASSVVYETFLSLVPLTVLVLCFCDLDLCLAFDINGAVQRASNRSSLPQHTAGILMYASLVTLLWSVGINGDNTLDAVVAPYSSSIWRECHCCIPGTIPALLSPRSFFTTFVNVGGTGATIALALVK